MSALAKCRQVAEALINFYRQRNIDTISELGIRKKVSNEVATLNKILKFKSKNKNIQNISLENTFKQRLDEVFPVARATAEIFAESDSMETDEPNDGSPGSKRCYIQLH